MAKRKERVRVVIDASIIGRAWTSPNRQSPSVLVYLLWFRHRLQLFVSDEIVEEYQVMAHSANIAEPRLMKFMERLHSRDSVTWVKLGRRIDLVRDPKDEHVLATADSGRVRFLITLDRDMLEMPPEQRRRFKFEIVTPAQFLERIA